MILFGDYSRARRSAILAGGEHGCAGPAGLSLGQIAAPSDVDLFFQDSKVFSGRGFAGDLGFPSGGSGRPATFAFGERHRAGPAGLSFGVGAARADVDLFYQDSKVFSGRGFAPTGSFASALEMRASALV